MSQKTLPTLKSSYALRSQQPVAGRTAQTVQRNRANTLVQRVNRTPKQQNKRKRKSLPQIYALALGALATAIVFTLLGLAVFNALIAEAQREINTLEDRVSDAKEERRTLTNNLAEAVAPENVINTAKDDLGMITPNSLIYVPRE